MENKEKLDENAKNKSNFLENSSPQLKKSSSLSNKTKKSNNNSVNQGNYLWKNSIYLEQIILFLYSQDSWLNENETEFLRQSVIQKRKEEFTLSFRATIVVIVAVFLTGLAWWGQRQASIRKVHAFRESAEANLQSNNALDAAVDILRARKTLEQFQFRKPKTELAEVQGTLHRVFYAARERNQFHNRESIDNIALNSEGNLLVTVKNNTVTFYRVSRRKDFINKVLSNFHRVALLDNALNSQPKQLKTFSPGEKNISSVALLKLDNDTELLATGSENGTVKLWKIEYKEDGLEYKKVAEVSEKLSEDSKEQKELNRVSALAFNKDNKLAVGQANGTVTLWKITPSPKGSESGKLEVSPFRTLSAPKSSYTEYVFSMAFNSKGELAILRLEDIDIWKKFGDNDKPTELPNQDKTYSVMYTDDNTLVRGTEDGEVQSIKIEGDEKGQTRCEDNSDKSFFPFKITKKLCILTEQGTIYSLASSNDGKLATLGADGRVMLWDASSHKKSSSNVSDSKSETPPPKPLHIVQLQEQGAPIKDVTSSLDGKTLAIGNNNGIVKILDISGKPLSVFPTLHKAIDHLALNPDGKILATVGEDGKVRLLDTEFPYRRQESPDLTGVSSVAFAPDGRLATVEKEKTVNFWKIGKEKNGSLIIKVNLTEDTPTRLDTEQETIYSIAFSPDGKLVATLRENETLENETLVVQSFPDTQTYNKKYTLPQGASTKDGKVVFTANDELAIITDKDQVRVGDLKREKWLPPLATQQGNLRSLTSFVSDKSSNSSRLLATLGDDGLVKLWQLSYNQLDGYKYDLKDEINKDEINSAVFSPNGNRLATMENGGEVKLWSISEEYNQEGQVKQLNLRLYGNEKQPVELKVTDVVFSGDANRLATMENGGEVKLWSISEENNQEGQVKQLNLRLPGNEEQPVELKVTDIAFSHNGNLLAGIKKDGEVELLCIIEKEYQQKPVPPSNVELKIQPSKGEEPEKFYDVAFSPDGDLLAAINNSNEVRLWNTNNDQQTSNTENCSASLKINKLNTPPLITGQDKVTSVVFSPVDNNLLAIGAEDGAISLVDISNKLHDKIYTQQGKIKSLVFSPDGNRLATIDEKEKDTTLKVWHTIEKRISLFKEEQKGILSVAFNDNSTNDNSTKLVTVNKSGWIYQWLLGKNEITNDDKLLTEVCSFVRDYLENSPELDSSDRRLCDGINPPSPTPSPNNRQNIASPSTPTNAQSRRENPSSPTPSSNNRQNTASPSTTTNTPARRENPSSPTPSPNNRQNIASPSATTNPPARPQNTPSPSLESNNEQNNDEKPISDRNQANELNSTSVEAYINQALTYHRQGNYQQAISSHSKAIDLNPNSAKAYSNRAAAYIEQKEYQKAFADGNKAISLKPDYAKAYINRGIAYYYQGNYKEAIADYNKAIELDPDIGIAYYNRSLAYKRLAER